MVSLYEKSNEDGGGTMVKSLGKVGGLLMVPVVFFLVPTSWFESRRSMCLIYNIFGVRCPGCGMTRAISCAVHGNFKQALRYNWLVVFVLPLLYYAWLRTLWVEYQKISVHLTRCRPQVGTALSSESISIRLTTHKHGQEQHSL